MFKKSPKFGIFTGVFYILVSIAFAILAIICLVKYYDEYDTHKVRQIFTFTMSVCIVVICLPIVIVSALLIRGSLQRRHSLMVPWIVFNCIGLAFYTASTIVELTHPREDVGMISCRCIGIGLEALFILTILSMYKDVRKDNIQKMLTGQKPISPIASIAQNLGDTAQAVNLKTLEP